MPLHNANTINLKNLNQIAHGHFRNVYQHPTESNILLKTCRLNNRDSVKYHGSYFMRYSVMRFGGFRSWFKDYEEYLALIWRMQEIPSFLPRMYGFCQTTEGPAMMVEKITGFDGNIARSVADILENDAFDLRLYSLLDIFFTNLSDSACVASDITFTNIVIEGSYSRMVLVDGLGDNPLLKTKQFSKFLRERKLKRKRNQLLATLKMFQSGVPTGK